MYAPDHQPDADIPFLSLLQLQILQPLHATPGIEKKL